MIDDDYSIAADDDFLEDTLDLNADDSLDLADIVASPFVELEEARARIQTLEGEIKTLHELVDQFYDNIQTTKSDE